MNLIFAAYQGASLLLRLQLGECAFLWQKKKNRPHLCGPFARSKSFHISLNASINHVILGDVSWIRSNEDKRKHSLGTPKQLDQTIFVAVVDLHCVETFFGEV